MSVIKIYRPKDAVNALGISRATLWRWVRDGQIPKPIKLGKQARGWREETLLEYIKQRENVV